MTNPNNIPQVSLSGQTTSPNQGPAAAGAPAGASPAANPPAGTQAAASPTAPQQTLLTGTAPLGPGTPPPAAGAPPAPPAGHAPPGTISPPPIGPAPWLPPAPQVLTPVRVNAGWFSPLSRFLLFLSKTDTHALQFCGPEARLTQLSTGAMVFLTGIFAFMSGSYALHSTIAAGAPPVASWVISFVVALIYATAIVVIDREIVSSGKGAGAWFRIPFAVLIGFVISFPLELRLLEGRINAEVDAMVEARNADDVATLRDIETRFTAEESAYRERLAKQDEQIRDLRRQAVEEARIITAGPRYRALVQQQEAAEAERARLERDYPRMSEYDARRRDEIRSKLDASKQEGRDFLTRAEALESITKKSTAAFWVSWLLRIFFVTLELMPALMKLTRRYNEYDAYLASRRELNIQKLHAFTNAELTAIANNPHAFVGRPESTDVMAQMMEDPGYKVHPHLVTPHVP